jgi:hypothetical protein
MCAQWIIDEWDEMPTADRNSPTFCERRAVMHDKTSFTEILSRVQQNVPFGSKMPGEFDGTRSQI